jgi:hypothetical protein
LVRKKDGRTAKALTQRELRKLRGGNCWKGLFPTQDSTTTPKKDLPFARSAKGRPPSVF